jgi:hypothetical protein
LYNRPEVAAVPSGLGPTPLIIIIKIIGLVLIKVKSLPLKSEVQQRSKQNDTNSDDSSTDMADGTAEFTTLSIKRL